MRTARLNETHKTVAARCRAVTACARRALGSRTRKIDASDASIWEGISTTTTHTPILLITTVLLLRTRVPFIQSLHSAPPPPSTPRTQILFRTLHTPPTPDRTRGTSSTQPHPTRQPTFNHIVRQFCVFAPASHPQFRSKRAIFVSNLCAALALVAD